MHLGESPEGLLRSISVFAVWSYDYRRKNKVWLALHLRENGSPTYNEALLETINMKLVGKVAHLVEGAQGAMWLESRALWTLVF